MSKRRLPSWARWKQQRVLGLILDGLRPDLAMKIGSAETAVRQRLGSRIGWRAARDARLVCSDEGGELRFAITDDVAKLSAAQKMRLLDMQDISFGSI